MTTPSRICVLIVLLLVGFAGVLDITHAASSAESVEVAPLVTRELPGGALVDEFSARTIVAAIEVDRDQAHLTRYTVKPRTYSRVRDTATEAAPLNTLPGPPGASLEVTLHGPDGQVHTQTVEVPFLCLAHGRESEVHVQGDTMRPHRTAVLVELPELPGFDRIEVAVQDEDRGKALRRHLGEDRLDIDRFAAAGTKARYQELQFADPQAVRQQASPKGSTVAWPEDFGDTELYRVYGDVNEIESRINVVILPDGYTYAQKTLMETHADNVVAEFRASSPFTEHDAFYNYILVYAYSLESGIDECDCSVVSNNAMGTFFPLSVPQCGAGENRCIRYGGDPAACDGGGLGNIISAELRAPAHDSTLIMSNTGRWGGCASDRGVFAGAHPGSPGIAVHEAGHSLGGLADEYGGNGCGFGAWEINTSQDAVQGAWLEWIDDIGSPKPGGQTFDSCIYRPTNTCKMNASHAEFCSVCRQVWSLRTFEHPNVEPTAPIASFTPDLLAQVEPGETIDFGISTRLPTGPGVDNEVIWTIQGPGFPNETVVATDVHSYSRNFPDEGDWVVRAEVIAAKNFIKPTRYQENAETLAWQVGVSSARPEEVLVPVGFLSTALMLWEQVAGVNNHVYRGNVADMPGDYGACFAANVPWSNSFIFDTQIPPSGTAWSYLVTGIAAAGEGPLGYDSSGTERVNNNSCQ